MILEELLSSKGRVKVLNIMLEYGALNLTEIMRKSGLSYTSVVRHLEYLKKVGIVKEIRYGKLRIFLLEERNSLVIALKNLLEVSRKMS